VVSTPTSPTPHGLHLRDCTGMVMTSALPYTNCAAHHPQSAIGSVHIRSTLVITDRWGSQRIQSVMRGHPEKYRFSGGGILKRLPDSEKNSRCSGVIRYGWLRYA
jgi:hypothetical protein